MPYLPAARSCGKRIRLYRFLMDATELRLLQVWVPEPIYSFRDINHMRITIFCVLSKEYERGHTGYAIILAKEGAKGAAPMLQVRNRSQKLAEVQHSSSVMSGICFTKPLASSASSSLAGAVSSPPSLLSPPALCIGGDSFEGPLAPGPSCLLLLAKGPGTCLGACPALGSSIDHLQGLLS